MLNFEDSFLYDLSINRVFLRKFALPKASKQNKMIVDNLKNASYYYNVNKGFEKAFAFLENIDLETCVEGTFQIDGSNIKAIISTNELKNRNNATLETHQKHIDIQIPLSQPETYGWKSASTIDKPKDNYDAVRDIELYNDVPSTYFTLSLGEFAIFLPEDAHAPLIGVGELKKIIFKIPVD